MDDLGCFKDGGEDGHEAVTDAVVTAPFGNFLAVEDVRALGIDGRAADADGKVGTGVDVEVKLAFEGD